jgi:hypothetical protein
MNESEKNQNRFRRNSVEGAEIGAEAKEKQIEEAEKKMGAKERAETISKEVKTTKNQIQNIVANMTQVIKAVAAIRAQLGLGVKGGAIPSVQKDEKILESLKKKLDGLFGEIEGLKKALVAEEEKAVREEHPDWKPEFIIEEAKKRVGEILKKLDIVPTSVEDPDRSVGRY